MRYIVYGKVPFETYHFPRTSSAPRPSPKLTYSYATCGRTDTYSATKSSMISRLVTDAIGNISQAQLIGASASTPPVIMHSPNGGDSLLLGLSLLLLLVCSE